jgi:hydroxyacyl-ACP dehydratase HTD2-like protein with hotdog domain
VEGHRNLLVHGPLSLTLMLQAISGHVAESTAQNMVVESIQYRNLAPLYCDEEMRICGKEKKRTDEGILYDIWIEGPTRGVAVKGTVRTMELSMSDKVNQ